MEHEAKQPKQCYMLTISFPVFGWGNFEFNLVFMSPPTAGDILRAVKERQAYYTDHANVNEFVLEVCGLLNDDFRFANSGWGRAIAVRGKIVGIRMTSEDWFDNTKISV